MKRQEKNQTIMFSKRGRWTQRKEKNGILKGKTKGKQNQKKNRKKRRILKTGLLGDKIEKETTKPQENNLFGPFCRTKAQKHGEKKTKPPKKQKQTKKHLFAFWQQPLLLVNFCFFQVALFHICKAVFC